MADDYSDDKNTAGVLAPNSIATGKIDASFDTDWFRFDARGGGHYRFSVIDPSSADSHGATISPVLYVHDAAGAMLPIYGNGLLEPVTDGTYFVAVSNGGTLGNYAIRATALTDDYGSASETASPVPVGGSIAGTLDYTGDRDRFKISLTANNYYTFQLSGSSPSSTETMTLNLTSAAGEWLGSVNPAYTSTGLRLTIRPTVSGDVYVDAVHRDHVSGTLPLTYRLTASQPFSDEYGDTRSTSASATLDAIITGTLQNALDVDMFKVRLEAGLTYSVNWRAVAPSSSHERISMELADASGRTIGSAMYSDLGFKTVTPAVTGDYYVSLRGIEGAYTMTVGKALDDYTANSSTTGKLVLGKDMKGKLEQGGSDRDWFAVKLTAGTTYWLSADTVQYAYGGQMRLLDSSGKELLKTTNAGSSKFVDTAAYVPTRTGTYYVEVSSNSSDALSYTVNARVGERDDHGSTAATASAMGLNQPVTGKLEIPRDTDTFKLSVEAGKTYGFLATASGNTSVHLSASDAAGASAGLSYWYRPGAGEGRVYSATATGDLYVTVAGNAAGPYTLTATEFGADDVGADALSAGTLAPSGSVTASLSNPIDRDAFRLTLQAGKFYVVQLLGAGSGNGTLDVSNVQFSVNAVQYTSSQTLILGNGAEPRILVMPSTSGDYLVNVSSYSGQMGSYMVKAVTLTGDASGPTLVAQSHAQNAVDLPLTSSKIELTFDEPIAIDKSAISLKDAAGRAVELNWAPGPGALYASDSKLILNAGSFLSPGTYTLSLPRQAVYDLAGNAHQGPETLTFTTVMPTTTSTSGADLLAPVRGGTTAGGAGIDTVSYGADVHIQYFDRTGNVTTLIPYQNGSPGVVDTLVDVERVLFGRSAYALDVDGTGGQAYRLYRAAFDRTPDPDGVGRWLAQMDKGMSPVQVASQLLSTPESIKLYGENSSDTQFVTQLYRNVLHRDPDAAGLQSWLNVLADGMSRAEALTGFSESQENVTTVATLIGEGFMYTLMA